MREDPEVVTKGPFDGYTTVEQWRKHVMGVAYDPALPFCRMVGGGPPPERTATNGVDGFWISAGLNAMSIWVPDVIAARDPTGRYRAGMKSSDLWPKRMTRDDEG